VIGLRASAPRIAFHQAHPFHAPILEPIHARLAPDLDCLLSADLDEIVRFDPQVLVQSEGEPGAYRSRLPRAMIVYTGHGFEIKFWGRPAMAASDFACLTSPWMRDYCVARGWRPTLGHWVTGYPPMDGVLRRIAAGIAAPASATAPTVLYAPTWNPYLSSVSMLGDRWLRDLFDARPDVRVLLKPHPHIPLRSPEWMARLEAWARADARVSLVEPDADFYALMERADVLLSDVSSIVFYYLALDRPLVLLNNPLRAQDPYFEPEGPEWVWRDMGLEVDREEDLAGALLESLRHPGRRADARARYRERVFGSLTDGRAAARIADRVRALVLPAEHEREWVDALWHAFEQNRHLRELEGSVSYRLARRLDAAPRIKKMVGGVMRRVLG
jgi:hypothetical protein